jgi:hypothetical protein
MRLAIHRRCLASALVAVLFSGTLANLTGGAQADATIQGKRGDRHSGKRAKYMKPTKEDLEEIRTAVLKYFEEKKPEFWDVFVAELRRGAIFPDGDYVGVGIWKYEIKDNRIALVRQPPVSPEMIYFGVYLVKENSRWKVVEDFEERERLSVN